MRRDCDHVRRRLASAEPTGALADHLGRCAACARYAQRVRIARRMFEQHHTSVEPDPGFADRVAVHLPEASGDLLGWAAWRLLPATLVLLLVLAWLSWRESPGPENVLGESPTENLLSWVVGGDNGS